MHRLPGLVSGFLLFSAIALAQPTEPPPPMPGRLVDAGGYRVHTYCTGEGRPAVVVVSGGFSVDWGLVQPRIAQLTRICTYDPAASAWSDKPEGHLYPSCGDRVDELHTLLGNAHVEGPYVIVGYSIGGLVARLFALRYPAEVAGMVIIDHAFIDIGSGEQSAAPSARMKDLDSPPVLISQTPITLDLEDSQDFTRLPARDQEAHRWALAVSTRPTAGMAAGYFDEVASAEQQRACPLGRMPLAVISTPNDNPHYQALQRKLLTLSRDSRQIVATHSSHMVIIDQPDVVVRAIRDVVTEVRRGDQ